MIKKFGYEYVTYEELYEAYLDCRKRKRTTFNALEFEVNENTNLYKLWYELNSMTYEVGKSIVFCVEKPVKREVFVADFRDRIVHHLLINRINDILENEFIEDSYSCRVGKGTDYGIRKCNEYLIKATDNWTKEAWIVKCDLKSFFMTIDKKRLYDKLCRFIRSNYKADDRDLEFMCHLTKLIVFNEPQRNCIMKQSWEHWDNLPKEKSLFFCPAGQGIPIGNLTSQIFANFYLSEFDHFVKETLGIEYYGRYVDDFFTIAPTKEEAMAAIEKCRAKLLSIGVKLHPKKFYVQPAFNGVKFIGAVIKKDRIYISNRTKGNFYAAIKHYADVLKEMRNCGVRPTMDDAEHIIGSINSYIGFLVHYATYNIRKKILGDKELMKDILRLCWIDKDYKKVTMYSNLRNIISTMVWEPDKLAA